MGQRFIAENLADTDVGAADSTSIPCKNVWHKSDMEQGRIPVSGIDTNARWGFSKSRGWVFGYKLHMSCSTGKIAVPLSACVTTANVYDPHMYDVLVAPLAGLVRRVAADSIYSGKELYDYPMKKGIVLACPIKRYRHTTGERLKRYRFFQIKERTENNTQKGCHREAV
ncbi:MAG: transposase [Candidatus Nitrosotenuis sp.]